MTCLSYVYIYIILKKKWNIKGKNNLKKTKKISLFNWNKLYNHKFFGKR